MTTCKRCGKDNLDHYKFCLGCGAELTSREATSRTRAARTTSGVYRSTPVRPSATEPTAAVPGSAPAMPAPAASRVFESRAFEVEPASPAGPVVGTPAPEIAPSAVSSGRGEPTRLPSAVGQSGRTATQARLCPQCGATVPAGFLFCGQCGHRIGAVGRTVFGAPTEPPGVLPVRGRLVVLRPDGTEGAVHPLQDGSNVLGRGQLPGLEGDSYLSPRHAEILVGNGEFTIRDLGSLNGSFLRILDEEELESGDLFRVGQHLLRFDAIVSPQPLEDGTEIMGSPNSGSYWGCLVVVAGRGVDGSAFPLFGDAVVLGRERGDILFPDDGYVSATHALLSFRGGRYFLKDLGSSNGTFLRLRGERAVPPGSCLLMGQQLFRLAAA